MLAGPVVEPARPAPGELADLGLDALWCVPVGALPPADVTEAGPLCDQAVIDRRDPGAARGFRRAVRIMRRVDEPERFDRPGGPVLGVGLVRMQPVDVHGRDIDVRAAADDPLREGAADAATGKDADRVQPGSYEEVPKLRRLADDRQQVGREALGAAEELPDPDLLGDWYPGHR